MGHQCGVSVEGKFPTTRRVSASAHILNKESWGITFTDWIATVPFLGHESYTLLPHVGEREYMLPFVWHYSFTILIELLISHCVNSNDPPFCFIALLHDYDWNYDNCKKRITERVGKLWREKSKDNAMIYAINLTLYHWGWVIINSSCT